MTNISSIVVLACAVVALCGACSNGHNNDNPNPTTSIVVPTGVNKSVTSQCIDSIKSQIKNSTILFVNSPDTTIDDVADVINQQIKNQKFKPYFSFTQNIKTQSVSDLSVSKRIDTVTSAIEFSSGLSLVENNTVWPLEISLDYKDRKPDGSKLEFEQKFNVNKNCHLRLISSTKTEIRRATNNIFNINETSHTLTGDQSPINTQVKVPPGAEFEPKMPEGNDASEMEKFMLKLQSTRIFGYVGSKMPMAELKAAPTDTIDRMNPLTGKLESFNGIRATILSGDKVLGTMGLYYSDSSPFNFSRIGNLENLRVNESIWDQTSLTKYEEIASRIVHIDHDQFVTRRPLTLKILTDHVFEFPNLQAYWDIISTDKVTNSDGPVIQYIMKGQTSKEPFESVMLNPNARRSPTDPYLKETGYIQISLPQSQDLIKRLKNNFSGSRVDMAQKILEVVNQTISYDYDMVSENTVGTLKTSEIFEKRKGVCQHFANLFATLSRGVGIPTRIITGFLLGENSAGRHAWNEIEIRKGVWLPIEPQMKTLDFDFSRYLPIAISVLYDDPKGSGDYANEIQGLVLTNLKIESVP